MGRGNSAVTWGADTNSQVAKLLGYVKHCRNESCRSYVGLRTWPYYYGLPDFSKDIEVQKEILDYFSGRKTRGALTIRMTPGQVTIMQGHYFVKGKDLPDAIWKFVTWVLQHEGLVLDMPEGYMIS